MVNVKSLSLSIVVVIALVITSVSHAALDSYLYLEGSVQGAIEGDVTYPRREDSILVYSYYHKLDSILDKSSGLPTGRRQHKPLTITKQVDKATPLLLQAWDTNERMRRFELHFYRMSIAGEEELFYKIILENAQIVSVKQYKPSTLVAENVQFPDMEQVSFTYSKLIYELAVTGVVKESDWQYSTGTIPADISGDGTVNMTDLALLATQWLQQN